MKMTGMLLSCNHIRVNLIRRVFSTFKMAGVRICRRADTLKLSKRRLKIAPCMQLARLEFELTSRQENCTVQLSLRNLTSMYVSRKGNEEARGRGDVFSLETVLNIHEKGFIMPETISDCRRWKTEYEALIWGQK